jgi:hypothetical protein
VKAREWYERANKKTDTIDSFSDYWRGFNNLYSSIGNGTERDKIQRFIDQNVSENEANEMLRSYQNEITYLLSRPVIDMRNKGKDTSPNINAYNVATNSLTKIKELFMIIYQVRCNLEHGQKSPSRQRDVRLCKFCSRFVAYILDHNT